MITVTLGTIPFQFDRAITWLDKLLDAKIIVEPVFVQYGATDISRIASYPLVSGEREIESARFTDITQRSRLVISHAGQGSTRRFAAQGLSFVLLPRLVRYKEHVDDHQLEFALSVSKLGVKYCVAYKDLEKIVLDPPMPLKGSLFEKPKLTEHLLEAYSSEEDYITDIVRQ